MEELRDGKRRAMTGKFKRLGGIVSLACLTTGCTDGPFYQMKKMNPYIVSQWNEDEKLGPVYEQRVAELEKLRTRLPKMESTEQQQWLTQLENLIRNDPSAEMRAQAVLTIASVPSAITTRALNSASADEVEKVRIMACQAWVQQNGTDAVQMLESLASRSEETTSVRKAAIESLAQIQGDGARSVLAKLMEDPSPAVQYQVAQSLQEVTGRDYGGDFDSWKRYLAGQEVEEPESPSMTAKMWNMLPSWR